MGLPTTRAEVKAFIEADNYSVNPSPCDDVVTHVFDNAKPVVGITVSDEATNVVTVTIQLTRSNGDELHGVRAFRIWVSDTAGAGECVTAPDGGVAVTTGTSLIVHTAGKQLDVLSDSTGEIVLTLTESGTDTFYVNVLNGNEVVSSSACSFS